MYRLSQVMLIAGMGMLLYACVIFALLIYPWSLAGLLFIAFRLLKRRREFTTFGNAKFAEERDLCAAKMLSR